METFPHEVDNIFTKDFSSFYEVKNKCLNLHSAASNGDSSLYTFGNTKNSKSKKRINSLVPALPNPVHPSPPQSPPLPEHQKLALGRPNTIFLKLKDIVR
jgi:hypothetical protein